MNATRKYSSYLISGCIHLLVLLLLAFMYVHTDTRQSWHQFEWLSAVEQGIVDEAIPGVESEMESALDADPEAAEEIIVAPPLLESPHWESIENSSPIVDPAALNRDLANALKDDSSTGASESAPYSSSMLEGGADVYFIRETSRSITPLMDDSVVVEFYIDKDGSVMMNSIKVLSYRKAEHWRSLREAMKNWRFGFTGAYNPRKVYRIRCNFRLD